MEKHVLSEDLLIIVNKGAAWVYVRSGNTWIQQGSKLVGTGSIGFPAQGNSVSLSADGNTAMIGGRLDNGGVGAAWVFTRNVSTWTQQGSKLVGTGNVGASMQGVTLSLSADGNTAIVGGFEDNSLLGAAWVWTRTANTWSQQGTKLVGSGNAGGSNQGFAVSLSANGNTAFVGGYKDNSLQGASWVYSCASTNNNFLHTGKWTSGYTGNRYWNQLKQPFQFFCWWCAGYYYFK
ncbi:MAG: hypothetical protein IPP46_12495 [Bacteroidetes bacterium]|nr:hypothetical protein [Bacteroidota bacterium]